MIPIALRGTLARRRRLLGTLLAVFLGVSFLTGTLTLSDTLRANFDRLFTDASAGTDVVVRNASELEADGARGPGARQRGPSPPPSSTTWRRSGVAAAVPSIEGYGQLRAADGSAVGGNGPPRRAANWVDDPELNPYRLVEGRAPSAPGEIVVNRGAAEEGDLAVGDRTVVETPQRVPVTVVGIATFGDADGMGRVTYVGFTLDDARRYVAAGPDQLSGVLVRAEDGTDRTVLADRVRAAVPDGLEVRTGDQLASENVDDINAMFLDMVRSFLLVFAGIALLVGGISIANTFSILVAQRTPRVGAPPGRRGHPRGRSCWPGWSRPSWSRSSRRWPDWRAASPWPACSRASSTPSGSRCRRVASPTRAGRSSPASWSASW